VIEFLVSVPWLANAFAFVYGCILGSFVNVLIHRLPKGRSVVRPRSRCPACGAAIEPYDNVPLLSYFGLLRGRCRRCRAGISIRYPAVEALVGAASVLAFVRRGPSLEYLVELVFVAAMVALVFIDYTHRILPDVITINGTVLGLALSLLRDNPTTVQALSGAALGAGLLFLVAEMYFRVRKLEGLGMGDVKMMAMVGAFLGWKAVLLTVLVGSFIGSVVGLAVMFVSRRSLRTSLPFGTFLGAAATLSLFVGAPVIEWYMRLF